jgi:hypothetical protein
MGDEPGRRQPPTFRDGQPAMPPRRWKQSEPSSLEPLSWRCSREELENSGLLQLTSMLQSEVCATSMFCVPVRARRHPSRARQTQLACVADQREEPSFTASAPLWDAACRRAES